jgi:GrpB-like predicted nucleotidyltransferase (UPF0157 family)
MPERVQVVEYDPAWIDAFVAEAQAIGQAMRGLAVRIHHIGSTAIPGIHAKPIIDILLEVDDIALLDDRSSSMEQLGYEAMGEFGIPGRRYFRKDDPSGIRTHHVHAFEQGCAEVVRHLAFRDYMIAHPEDARAYSALKRKLATQHPEDMEAYMDGKDPYIKEHQAKAVEWANGE